MNGSRNYHQLSMVRRPGSKSLEGDSARPDAVPVLRGRAVAKYIDLHVFHGRYMLLYGSSNLECIVGVIPVSQNFGPAEEIEDRI